MMVLSLRRSSIPSLPAKSKIDSIIIIRIHTYIYTLPSYISDLYKNVILIIK